MSAFQLDHPLLGPIRVTERRGSGKISARWKNGLLHINVPAGLPHVEILRLVNSNAVNFERIRPLPRFADSTDIHIPGGSDDSPAAPLDFTISIRQSPNPVGDISVVPKSEGNSHQLTILVDTSIDITSTEVQRRINNALITLARRLAPTILLPRARQLASRLGLRVDKWEIAHGHNVLGTCFTHQRRIRLSCINVFLTPELRDYIIFHELAHLTHSDHSPAFHSLCNRYCGGREQNLIRLLHSFPWPINR